MKTIDYYKKYEVPAHIIDHMKKVAAISLFLMDNIKEKRGTELNIKTTIKAALLHDILKLVSANHEEDAADIFEDEAVSSIIFKHRFNSLIDPVPSKRPVTLEEKIVYYADKRVKHDEIVSIKERIADGRRRYLHLGYSIDEEKQVVVVLKEIEKEICELAEITPETISEPIISPYLDEVNAKYMED
jgi:HD superfamily phosphodiesterase